MKLNGKPGTLLNDMSPSRFLFILVIAGLITAVLMKTCRSSDRGHEEPQPVLRPEVSPPRASSSSAQISTEKQAKTAPSQATTPSRGFAPVEGNEKLNPKDQTVVVNYEMDDGVAVALGDVVLGVPHDPSGASTGFAKLPNVQLWPTTVIPYHIQHDVPDANRIHLALALFGGTVIEFVPHTNETEALVFQNGTNICKSYVGRIGGLQPIWLTPECSPPEIAHEILHALGFIHEQNRTDRENFITVLRENIEEKYADNFMMLPPIFMIASGQGPFDYQSIMLYPDKMFSRNGQATMLSKSETQPIQPGSGLSPLDREKLNSAYASRVPRPPSHTR